MRTSDEGKKLIKDSEGLRLKSYQCSARVWTIGYGHTKDIKKGQVISKEEAERLFELDLIDCEDAVEKLIKIPLKQSKYDAIIDFVFNFGESKFGNSKLLKMINENSDDEMIRYEFPKWRLSAGVISPGLVARRKKEAELYFS